MTQHYVGTKIITAWKQEKDGKPGYAVKYEDGYISWSPAEAFEKAYIAIGHIGQFQPHEQRVFGEHATIDNNYEKLKSFIGGKVFPTLTEDEQELLNQQLHLLEGLRDVLTARTQLMRRMWEERNTDGA